MVRFLAILVCLAAAGVAGWQVYLNLWDVFEEWWIPYAGGGGTGLVVFLLLYLPLGRPVADMISDRLSAMHQRMKKTTSGTGIDEIPQGQAVGARPTVTSCTVCGGPGGPICPSCFAQSQQQQGNQR
jgi:hypothetical protein